jgi:phosphonate metabolism protein PhnN/1,5-bisphosphokinase (PRPP-forming)
MLVLVVGPSGAGKDTLLDAVRASLSGDPRVLFARREITRPATPGGEDHLPVDEAAFAAKCDAGGYALWWHAHGLRYGISSDIEAALAQGVTVVASVSRAVIAEAATRYPVRVVEITAPPAVLAARLQSRARESAEDIARRLAREVALPDGLEVVRVINDGSVAQGAERLRLALLGAQPLSPPCRGKA